MVADRLLRYGRIERAIWLYERAYQQSDYLPQTRRTLALALAKRAANAKPATARADLRRAIGLLNEIVMKHWDDAYDGIELVALMEANELLPKLIALGERDIPLDPRLRACWISTSAWSSSGTRRPLTWTCGWTSPQVSALSTTTRAPRSAAGCRTT